MPSNEIITGLRNAIERNESLENAMQIMINSGYDSAEVQEASKFVTSGALNMQEQEPNEHLIMPEQKKSLFSKVKFWKKEPRLQRIYNPDKEQPQQQESIPQNFISKPKVRGSLVRELQGIKPKRSYAREIILGIILLILLGILILTYVFKDNIVALFS